MQARINLIKDDVTGKVRLVVEGSKFAALIGVLGVTVASVALVVTVVRVPKAYNPYEGTLVEVSNDWLTSWFGDDGYPQKCILLEQEDGKRIKRFISEYTLFQQRIEKGDYIYKERGFYKKPRCRDKETMPEMLKRVKKMVR